MNNNFTKLKIVLATLTLSSIAHAHPQLNDSISKVGVGSTLLVTRDVNVKPNDIVVYFADRDRLSKEFNQCTLRLKETSSSDRVLKQGKTLKIANVSVYRADYVQEHKRFEQVTAIKFSNQPSIEYMTCSKEIYTRDNLGVHSYDITIGETITTLSPFFELTFAKPTEL